MSTSVSSSPHSSDTRTPVSSSSRSATSSRRPRNSARSKTPGRPRPTAQAVSRAAISASVRTGTGLAGGLGISIPSVGAFSSSPSVTSQRQNRRMPRSRVPTVEGSHVSASSASQAAIACRVSSSSVAGRPRPVSQRPKYRTDWLHGSIVRGAFAAGRRCRRKDTSRSSSRIATAAAHPGNQRPPAAP
jgi:hypothetical protein